ncbi:hypothetical protein BG011_008998 [Mortierella polycephala]|uniref:Uncharacterized protein n=1 Tax=Mortierella polycephala TaxID=41804 RepID=A0A9P6PQ34_9FUNG|nr:hypothetical protein BG011_008998 [Mortierella polycephala]
MSSQLSRDDFGASFSTPLIENSNPLPGSTKDEIAPAYNLRQLASSSHIPSLSSAPSASSSPSPSFSSSSMTSPTDGSGTERDNGGIENTPIQVNSTIQTVLISLGTCVGILFLLGIIALKFISHKNKRAEKKKTEASNDGNSKQGGGTGGLSEKTPVTSSTTPKIQDEKSSMVSIVIDEKNIAANTTINATGTSSSAGVGVGTGGTTRAQEILASLRRSRSNSNSVHASQPGSTQSPKSSIVGGVGTAVGGGGPSGTGSFQMNISGPHGPGTADPRNSFIEAGHPPNGRRPSLTPTPTPAPSAPLRAAFPGFGQQHHSNLQIGIYSQEDTAAYNALDLSSPMFTISPSTAGTDNSDRNPFASPPPSAGSKSNTPLDPFRTPSSSQFSLSLAMPGTAARGVGYNPGSTYNPDLGEDNDSYSFPPPNGPSSSASMKNGDMTVPTHTDAAGSGTSAYNGSSMNTPLALSYARSPYPLPLRAHSTISTPTFNTAASPVRTLDNLSEPKLVLRQLQSASPAYHRHTLMHMTPSPTSSAGAVTTSSGGPIPNDIHGSPPGATTRATVERQASVSPGVCDRRSLAGSVVVPSSNSSSSGGGSSSSSSSSSGGGDRRSIGAGSINEGNAWYRKRASVVIPEGGTAHVRLWRDDGEAVAENGGPMGVRNRSSRSGSQSSSQSQGSNHSGSVGIRSPLRLNQVQYQTPEELDEGEGTCQVQKQSPTTSSTHLSTFEAHSQVKMSEKDALTIDTASCGSDEPSPRSVRNGAAVFEGLGLQASKGSISRTPSLSRAHSSDSCMITIMDAPVVIEPEPNPDRHVTKPNNSVVTIMATEEQEQVDQVVVRLRTPRRGSHSGSCSDSSQRRSYLDDYREQQQQLKA